MNKPCLKSSNTQPLRQMRIAAFTATACLLIGPLSNVHATAAVADANQAIESLPSYSSTLVRMFVFLGLIIVGLFLAAKWLPRFLGRQVTAKQGQLINVIEVKKIEANKRLYVVRIGEQHVLLGATGDHLVSLANVTLDQQALSQLIDQKTPAELTSGDPGRSKDTSVDRTASDHAFISLLNESGVDRPDVDERY